MIWTAGVLSAMAAGWLLGHGDAAANLRRGGELAPQLVLIAGLGVGFGFYGRSRVQRRRAYASPTRAYAGKAAFFAALAAAAAAIGSPLDWPPSALPGCAASGAAGLAIWIANLPPRL